MQDIEQFVAKKNALYGDAFLLLIEIEYAPGQFVRWARVGKAEGAVTFEGNQFVPFGIGNPKRSQNSRGEIPIFDLPIANPRRIFQSTLQHYIIEGKRGRLITADRDQLDDPTAKAEEWFTIETANAHAQTITLTCKSVRFNPRRCRIPSRTMTRRAYPGLLGPNRSRFL